MNQKEIRQVTAHDEKWVPTTERVKIGTNNVRLETTMPQKEETFQVIIDVIKNSTCYKAFTISAEVPKIFMQQFWHTILDICPSVQGEEFIEVPYDKSTLTFPIDLGYKGPLYKHPSMYVDHKHQPWRTLAAIINMCLSGKTASNDRLRKSRIDILWGMFYRENVDFPKLIWEDFAFQIDHRMEKQRRRKNMPKSMSLTKAAEEEAARQVHATHERTESDPELARRRPSEKLTADTMQALKASRKSIRNQPHAGGSSEGTGIKPGVPDESTITPTTSSEGTGTKPGVLNEEKVTSEAKADVTLDWVLEQKSEYSKEDRGDDENIPWESTYEDEEKKDDDDDKSIDLEKTDDEEINDEFMHSEEYVQYDEETDDELVHGDEQVNDDEDEEMTNAEDADTRNGDEEITDAAKADVEKAEEVKDDIKKSKLPPSGSNLSVSLGFDAEINSLLDVQIQQEISHIQSPSVLTVPVFVISKPLVLTPIPKTSSIAPATTLLPPPTFSSISHVLLQTTTPIPTPPITTKAPPVTTILDPLHAIIQRLSVLEKDVQELKEVDNTTTLRASLRSEILSDVNAYLGSSLGDALQKVLQKHMKELIQQYPQQVNKRRSLKSLTVKKALEKTSLLLDKSSSQA
ncbi:hypothetical protein Tco_1555149 [Tanacetum coccineum]